MLHYTLQRRAEAPVFDQARRRVLLGAAAFVALPACESRAAWDGSSAAMGSCPLGEEGDECRVQTLRCARRFSVDTEMQTGHQRMVA